MTGEYDAEAIARRQKTNRNPPVPVGLAGGDAERRQAVKAAFEGMKDPDLRITELDDSYSPLSSSGASPHLAALIVILDDGDPEDWRRQLRNYISNGTPVTAALSGERSFEACRAALRAGAEDVIGAPPNHEEALRFVLRTSELHRRALKISDRMVCSLVSLSGGVGVTCIAMNTALALQRLFEKRAVLVELDLQAAPLAVMLDIEPEHTVGELSDPTIAIDSMRLESVLCKHESGLRLLAAPKRIEESELISPAVIETTIKVLRSMFDLVLIDCGSNVNESSVVAWEYSDNLLYVIDQNITAIGAARRFFDLYSRLGLEAIHPDLLLNRYRSDHPITGAEMETALGQPLWARIPRDDQALIDSQVTGQDLWKSPSGALLRASFENVARKLFAPGTEDAGDAKPSLVSRLFGAIRR